MKFSYSSNSPCPYAEGKYAIMPKGFEEGRDLGGGSVVMCEHYAIYFMPDVSDELKERIIHDYGEYEKKRRESLTF